MKLGGYPPGTQFMMMMVPLHNTSGGSVVLRDVEVLTADGFGDSARVVKRALAAPRRLQRGDPVVALGIHFTDPMVMLRGQTCAVQETVSLEGYEIAPTEEPVDAPVVVLHIETVAPGRVRLEGVKVRYEQDGSLYEQEFFSELRLEVVRGTPRPRLSLEEDACLHLARLPPGIRGPAKQ
jgi:hypothetical protein